MSLTFPGKTSAGMRQVYACLPHQADGILASADTVRYVELGILGALSLYGLSLYLRKRTESYLLAYAVYITLLFLWTLLLCSQTYFSVTSSTFYALRAFLILVTLYMSLDIGFSLAGLRLPKGVSRRALGTVAVAAGAAVALLIWGGLATEAVLAPIVSAVVLYTVACAFACVTSENFWLVAAIVLMTFFHANGTVLRDAPFHEAFFYSAFFTAPLFDMPLVFAYMVATNSLFARKFAEAEDLAVSLDLKVAERTRRLAEQQEQRHALMVNVFHDLRSPLFVIKGCAEMLPPSEPPAQRVVDALRQKADSMGNLTERLFFLAKLEDGQVIFSDDAVDLSSLVDDLVLGAFPTPSRTSGTHAGGMDAGETTVRVVGEVEPGVEVVADKGQLQRALENVLDNAVKHSPEGSNVEVSLTTEPGFARIAVTDHGEGIPVDELESIFERYYRLDTSANSRATGLGLSISKAIVERLGGTIAVASEVGEGSTFTVRLPLWDGPRDAGEGGHADGKSDELKDKAASAA